VGTLRTFILIRNEDETGVSGIGAVAEGVEFSDRTVALRWVSGAHKSTVVWESIESVEAVHGHGGNTRVYFVEKVEKGASNKS
jgi:hypothetical protein